MPTAFEATRRANKLRQYLATLVLVDIEEKGSITLADVRRIEAEIRANPEARAEALSAHEGETSGTRPPRPARPMSAEARTRRSARAKQRYLALKADPVAYARYQRASRERWRARYARKRRGAA
jgi:D-serine deaminase-like pyridoxal phosphate-dependent protein